MSLWASSAVGLKRHLKSWRGLLRALRLVTGILTALFGVAGPARADTTSVATLTLSLSQPCQGETWTDKNNIAQRLVVKAWYPSRRATQQAGTSQPSPVLFFNAGWGGSSDSHQDQFHELVARGFVVISVDHRLDLNEYDIFLDFSSEEAFKRTKIIVDRKAHQFALDNVAVFDALEAAARCATSSEMAALARQLDFNRAGIFGYSFGGAVAAQTAWQDSRFKAAANLDGWLFAEASVQGISQPFMAMSDDTPVPTAQDLVSGDMVQRLTARLNQADYNQLRANMMIRGGYYLVLTGSNHQSFIDVSQRSIKQQFISLLPGSRRFPEIINAYVVAFFNRYLRDGPADLIDRMPSPYEEVRLEFAKPPVATR